MDIQDELRQIACRSGISAYALAKSAGLVVAVVQRWRDGGGLRVGTAEKIAAALGYRLVLTPEKKTSKR